MNPKLSESELQLFELLRKDKLEDYKVYTKRTNKNIFRGIIEKYPESAHFIYELIQNADDAKANNVYIFLYKDKLVFKHDGKKQFDITDVTINEEDPNSRIGDLNALLSACSNKEDNKEKIGKFGVGFKSVFQYTNNPCIYDDKFWFNIEHYIIPNLIEEDYPNRKQGETVFVLPFFEKEKAYFEIKDRLSKLSLPIIFLNNIKKVVWVITEDNTPHVYTKEVVSSGNIHDIDYELCKLIDGKDTKTLYLFHRNISTSEGVFKISVGYFLTAKGLIDTEIKPYIHSYFSTSDTFEGCFICNAPFLLTDNRDRIMETKTVNDEFIRAISRLAADSLLCLRDIGTDRKLITDNIFKMANIKDVAMRNYYLKQYYTEIIKTQKIVLTKSQYYERLSRLQYASQTYYDLFTSKQISQLYKNQFVDLIYIKDYREDVLRMKKGLSIFSLDSDSLSNSLNSEFMELQDPSWINNFFRLLHDDTNLWKKNDSSQKLNSNPKIWFMPIIKTSSIWVSPYIRKGDKVSPNVYLPCNENSVSSEAFFFIDNDMYSRHKTFFDRFELKQPDIADYIEKEVLAHNNKDTCGELSKEKIKNDFLFIYHLWKENKFTDDIANLLINGKYQLVCKCNNSIELKDVSDVYLMNDELKVFMSESKAYYVDIEFYMTNDDSMSDSIRQFLISGLKVKERPSIIERQYEKLPYEYSSDWPEQAIELLRRKELSCSKSSFFIDYNLDGFNFSQYTEKISHLLWSYLCSVESPNQYCKGYVRYVEWHGKTYYMEQVDSTILRKLKEDKWICCNDDSFCSPKEITVNDFWSLGYTRYDKWTDLLNFCQNDIESILHKKEKEEFEKQQEEKARRENEQQQWKERNVFLSKWLKDQGYDSNKILEEACNRISQGKEPIEYNSCTIPTSSQVYGQYTTNKYQEFINNVGEENMAILANNVNEVMEYLDREYWYEPSNVRQIAHVIGCKIYELYLRKNCIEYEYGTLTDCFDFKMGNKYVSVITTLKSIQDGNIPIGLTRSQNYHIQNNRGIQFRIVRISLSDIHVYSSFQEIIGLYGKAANIADEHLLHKCQKLAEDYWNSISMQDFDKVSPEYAIQIERKN